MKAQPQASIFAPAFDEFMRKDFESGVDSSTKASWGGSGYSVELFEDGTYRTLWDNSIGNCYESEGVILKIPALGDDEWDDDPDLRFYENARAALMNSFENTMEFLV